MNSESERLKGNHYEVFLSFRGKDTGKGFTDYLYTSLVSAGIQVFKNDNELRVSEEISPELLDNIMQSKILIPIISENYTSSKWCLQELTQMLKCQRSRAQIVLPIYYKVKPSQVRVQHLTSRSGNAINAHNENLDELAEKEWEEALNKINSLKTWELEKLTDGYEGEFVKIVVTEVMRQLKKTSQPVDDQIFVGLDNHLREIMTLIDIESNERRTIVICGMKGIGKTTLATAMYCNLSHHFKHHSLVAKIRETSDIRCLQKQLIDDILRSPHDVPNVLEGIDIIKSQFASKKVLILLDDVDDSTHLNALVGDINCFDNGSVVIITTRHKSIHVKGGACYCYELMGLDNCHALLLFSRYAFQDNSPPIDFLSLTFEVVSIIGGVPLFLEIMGSFLYKKEAAVWKMTLKKLEEVPHTTVQEKLRISCEALSYEEKQIFLDIACLFIGSSKQSPTYMWDACDFFPWNWIEGSSLRYLIKFDKESKLMMSDQLRNLGREIVQLENPKKPQKRSRLWIHEEAVDVLDNNKGTGKNEALCLGRYGKGRTYTAEQFKEFTNLRFLQVNGAIFTGDFQNLLPKLRWLQWQYCPSDFSMVNFHLNELVILDLSWSEISEDWGGWGPLKMATKLKVLNLMGCLSLRRTPDLSTFKSLEILILEDCENLEKIHPSIGSLVLLTQLDLSHSGIEELPESMNSLKKLSQMDLSYSWIAKLPEFMASLMSLTQLDLSHSGIEELPKSMSSLTLLTRLDLSHTGIRELPESISSLVSLTHLGLSHLGIKNLPESMDFPTKLTKLDLSHSWITKLPKSINSLHKLEILDASNCASLTWIPNSINNLSSLSFIDLRECHKLAQLPDSIGSLKSLQCLLLRGCCSLIHIPHSIGKLASLIELDLKSTAIVKLPSSIWNLKNLRILDICRTQITTLPSPFFSIARVDGNIDWELK